MDGALGQRGAPERRMRGRYGDTARAWASGDELPRAARRRNASYQEAIVSELAAEQAAQLPVAARVRSDTDGIRKRSALSGGGIALSDVHRVGLTPFSAHSQVRNILLTPNHWFEAVVM